MGQAAIAPITITRLGENLAEFAINREDTKALLGAIARDERINMTTVEYELQILKILSVGWAVSFYMEPGRIKSEVTRIFWEQIRDFSRNISRLAQTTTGQSVDYFAILKQRMDQYVDIMKKNKTDTGDPAWIMGPAFADACGTPDNAAVILAGTKMFTLTLGGIKAYMDAVDIQPS